MSPPKYLPLRCETTAQQWWFASPIDWAFANGHYHLVRHLLHIDPRLLTELTSLPRLRRLEALWDDDHNQYDDVSKWRSHVAQKLLQECETNKGYNSLIRAGYGGWVLYTAASAGDLVFINQLLDRDPLLVFGEGEYGISDLFYAAARSGNSEVFRVMLDCALSPRGRKQEEGEISPVFRSEIMNRAVHAAARGGNVEVLTELLGGGSHVLGYTDALGSTLLHSAAGKGHLEVVKSLVSSNPDIIIKSVDDGGNTALHVAALRGHLAVMEALITASPSSASLTNNNGDTLLHMAVSGFSTPSFTPLGPHMELMKQLLNGKLIPNIEDIINVTNTQRRTALHMAIVDNIQSDVVELLMSVRYVDLNVRDADGNTALDLIKQRPRSSPYSRDEITAINVIASSHVPTTSPGTSFRIPDAEMLSHTGFDASSGSSCAVATTTPEYNLSGEMFSSTADQSNSSSRKFKKLGSMSSAKRHLKILLRWLGRRETSASTSTSTSTSADDVISDVENNYSSLRERFSRQSSFPISNKRILSLQGNQLPTKKKLMYGDRSQVLPKSNLGSPSSAISEFSGSWSSPVSSSNRSPGVEKIKKMRRSGTKNGSFNLRLMNNYFCFGAQGVAVENSINGHYNHNQESVVV